MNGMDGGHMHLLALVYTMVFDEIDFVLANVGLSGRGVRHIRVYHDDVSTTRSASSAVALTTVSAR
jgi:hypothetical protein